jgi:hypothetical protein
MRLGRTSTYSDAFTLVETAFAAALVAVFFAALFLINSQCLYFVNCSREILCASGILQTRMEQLRNCHWSQVTASDGSYISGSNVLGTAPPGAGILGSVTEVITVDKYPKPSPSASPSPTPPIQVTRASNGAVTVNQQNTSVSGGDMAFITIQLTWTTAPGARSRSVMLSTIWAENTR